MSCVQDLVLRPVFQNDSVFYALSPRPDLLGCPAKDHSLFLTSTFCCRIYFRSERRPQTRFKGPLLRMVTQFENDLQPH